MNRLVALVSLCALSHAAPAASRDRVIVSVEARSQVARDGRDLSRDLRDAVKKELDGLDMSRAPKDARFVLSASLVTLDTSRRDGAVASRAKVSLALKDARRGALFAVIEGAATAEAGRASGEESERDALAGAVKGAMAGVPRAVAAAK
ncbi:MAG: hypothetical protein IT374_08300 [Polyangiaceae bacterium]|nr:hypothetical protein [Polyangiaceae bacterium]